MTHLTYEKLIQAVLRESVSPTEILAMSEQLADSVHGWTVEEAREPLMAMLATGKEESDVDLDIDLMLSDEVSKRANEFERYESMRHIGEAIWRAKSRRAILDVAWELVQQCVLRPTGNSTERFDLTQKGFREVNRWQAAHEEVGRDKAGH